jgi:hypothetical protein
MHALSERAILRRDVTQAGQPDAEPAGAKLAQEPVDAGSATHRHDGDAFSCESPAAPFSQSLERGLVAHPLTPEDCRISRYSVVPGRDMRL